MKLRLSVCLCTAALSLAGCDSKENVAPGPAVDVGGKGGAGPKRTGGSGGSSSATGGSVGSGGATSTGGGSGGGGAGGNASGSGGGAGSVASDASTGDVVVGTGDGPSSGGDGGNFTVPPGMTNLFDGTSLMGWKGDMNVWKLNAAEKAIEGITGDSNGGTYFYTDGDYDDFRFVATEMMVATPNHLGICFWGGRGGNGAMGCLDVIPPSGSIWDYGDGGQKPVGVGSANNGIKYQWHQVEILAMADGTVLVAVNGKQTTTYKKAGRPKKGPIGLQAHAKASHQRFKDIWVEANPKERRLLTVK